MSNYKEDDRLSYFSRKHEFSPSTDTHSHNIETTKLSCHTIRGKVDSTKYKIIKLKPSLPPVKSKRFAISKSTEVLPIKPLNGFYLVDVEHKKKEEPYSNKKKEDLYITANKHMSVHSLSPIKPLQSIETLNKKFFDNKYKQMFNEVTKIQIWKAAASLNKKNLPPQTKKYKDLPTKTRIRDYINKTRDIILLKQSYNIRLERSNKIDEYEKSQLEAINQSIKTLKQSKEKIESECFDKYNECLKQLNKKIQDENRIKVKFIIEKNILSKSIQNIQDSIKALTEEKEYYMKWIVLLFQIKHHIKNKQINSSFLDKHQTKLVFNTFEELNEVFINLQKKNLSMLQNKSDNLNSLEHMQQTKDNLNQEYENLLCKQRNEIKEKNSILKSLKNKYMNLIYNRMKYSSNNFENKEVLFSFTPPPKIPVVYITRFAYFKSLEKEAKEIILSKKHAIYTNKLLLKNKSHLYNKVFNVFTTSLYLENEDLIKKAVPSKMTDKVLICDESAIKQMLEYIEQVYLVLINLFHMYMSNDELIPLIKMTMRQIELDNRKKKNKFQKELLKEKEEERNRKIKAKNEKVLYLPNRKIRRNYLSKMKNIKFKVNKSMFTKEPEFEDFMYDLYDD